MKKIYGVLIISLLILTQACSANPSSTEAASPQNPEVPPATETSAPNTPEVIQSAPDVSTSVALNSLPTPVTATLVPGGSSIPEAGITLDDKGKTFHLKVGESFLLNLGIDMYDWTVTIDNENVLHSKMGVMVIKGAQGIYDALAPGTVILSAAGDPICLKSNPPCASPSILFTVTIIVE